MAIAKPQNKTLTEALIEVIDSYASSKNLDPQLTLDAVARSVNQIDAELKARLRQYEDTQRRAAFDKVFNERKAQYESEIAAAEFPFRVRRSYIQSGRHLVECEGIRGSIINQEAK
jgi:hypothetical protein